MFPRFDQLIVAPFPGEVVEMDVLVGQQVAPGQSLVVIKAMGMLTEMKAVRKGVVEKISTNVGAQVTQGEKLIVIN